MTMNMARIRLAAVLISCAAALAPPAMAHGERHEQSDMAAESPASAACPPGTILETLELDGRAVLDVLGDKRNLGTDDLEIGVIEIKAPPPGSDFALLPAADVPQHRHQSTEAFYILSGRLEHIVGSDAYVLGPGQLAVVRANQPVAHRVVSEEPLRAVVIWSPGGEIGRLKSYSGFEKTEGSNCDEQRP